MLVYIAYYKMHQVGRESLPKDLQEFASPNPWLCMAENGSVILADHRDNADYWWDWKAGKWHACGTNGVVLRDGRIPC